MAQAVQMTVSERDAFARVEACLRHEIQTHEIGFPLVRATVGKKHADLSSDSEKS